LIEDSAKANLLASQFASVYITVDRAPPRPNSDVNGGLQDIPIERNVVKNLLLQLNPTSAPGPDNIHPKFVKEMADFLTEPLCQIFRLSLDSGRLPKEWKIGVIKPIFKGGDPANPQNYRPICLTSVICKVMEKLLKKFLQSYLSSQNGVHPAQHGFQKSRSCVTNLLAAREKWVSMVDAGKSLDVVFIDFSRAFDKVPHQHLIWKLRKLGISGKVLNWLTDFLPGRILRVQVNDSLSDQFTALSGVPQGSVLGPELFKIFINDLPSALQVDCLLYADDVKLWAEVSPKDDADELQLALDRLHRWSSEWLLPVNKEKCAVLSIGNKPSPGAYHIGGYLLRNTNQEKDLGVIISSDLRTSADTAKKVASATRVLHGIRRAFASLTPDIFRKLFVSLVRPILEYGSPAVYPMTMGEAELLEKVQRRGSKWVSGIRNLEYEDRLRALNLFPLRYRRLRGDLIFTRRILHDELGSDLRGFFQLNEDHSRRGHGWKLYKQRRSRCPAVACLSSRVVNHWNGLPRNIADEQSEERFKRLLDEYYQLGRGSCCSLHH
jgi:hypothetical protein